MSILFNATDLSTGRTWNVYLPAAEQGNDWREELSEVNDLVTRLDRVGFSMPRIDIIPADVERPAIIAQAIGRSGVLIRRLHNNLGTGDQFERLKPLYEAQQMMLVSARAETIPTDPSPRWYRRLRRRVRNGWARAAIVYRCARRRVLPWESQAVPIRLEVPDVD